MAFGQAPMVMGHCSWGVTPGYGERWPSANDRLFGAGVLPQATVKDGLRPTIGCSVRGCYPSEKWPSANDRLFGAGVLPQATVKDGLRPTIGCSVRGCYPSEKWPSANGDTRTKHTRWARGTWPHRIVGG
jgi:hypothetical protein